MRLFVDSNIIIDYLAVREPFYSDARKLMILGALGEADLWVSASQFSDIFYVLTEGGKTSLSGEWQARLKLCRSFLNICGVLDADIDATLDLNWSDLEDAGVYRCAQKVNADFIITRDLKGFAASSIPILDAAGFFAYLEREKNLSYEELRLGELQDETEVCRQPIENR
jgi:predicted nucleic acid-binding protein